MGETGHQGRAFLAMFIEESGLGQILVSKHKSCISIVQKLYTPIGLMCLMNLWVNDKLDSIYKNSV